MEFIFGIKGKWLNGKEQHCERCALMEICDQFINAEIEAQYICADDNPFSHRHFLSQESFRESIRKQVEYTMKKFNLRKGQAIFNAIDTQYEKLASFVKDFCNVDCFYHDEEAENFLNVCFDNVDNPEYIKWRDEQRRRK